MMEKKEGEVPETNEEKKEEVLSPAEQAKKLGNDAFLSKDYKKAIEHYSEAIRLDPAGAIYYANRSACHAFLKDWQKAYEDALTSVSKDSKYLKGYFRLASAQAELQMFFDAETTLKAVLALEPGNEIAIKQLKSLETKRANALKAKKAASKPVKQLDENQRKEFMELQEQLSLYQKDLRGVKMRANGLQREQRINNVTVQQISELDTGVPVYKSVGKAFFSSEKTQIEKELEEEMVDINKGLRECMDRQEYLERRIASNTTNLQELLK